MVRGLWKYFEGFIFGMKRIGGCEVGCRGFWMWFSYILGSI